MALKFYTADWHLNSRKVLEVYSRPFPSIEYMNEVLISMCNMFSSEADTVVHIGDLFCYGTDGSYIGTKENPQIYLGRIKANFVNIEGNHDRTNKVKSIGKYLRTSLGPFSDVSISHYPSTSDLAEGTYLPGDIHLCGHVHDKWKYLIDRKNQVLNVNLGIDVWDYKIVSEDKLISYIKKVMLTQSLNGIRNSDTL